MITFQNIPNIREQYLSHNDLSVIWKESFGQEVFMIETLALDNNHIRTVDIETFVNMTVSDRPP